MPLSWNLGNLTSWNPLGHSRPVTGLLYLFYSTLLCAFFCQYIDLGLRACSYLWRWVWSFHLILGLPRFLLPVNFCFVACRGRFATCFTQSLCIVQLRKKGKGRLWVLQHCCLEAYWSLTRMSSFIHLQRRYTHQAAWETSASEGRNYTWSLASNQ